MDNLTPEMLRQIEQHLPTMPLEDQRRLLTHIRTYKTLHDKEQVNQSFLAYVNKVWPSFIYGPHHKLIADAFDRIVNGSLKRLIINMAPRMTKSEFTSWLLPSYYLGRYPERKVIQASNTADLAAGFGRRVRNTVKDDREFKALFPGITLATDSTAAAHWHTNKQGEYFAIGVTGKVTGKGADLFIIDDPHSEQEAKQADFKPEVFDDVYSWFTSGPRQRLQPNAAIVIVMTRWSQRDLTGRLIAEMKKGGERYEVIELPAILDEDPNHPENERSLWPGFWKLEELQATRRALEIGKWNAQYQQNPTSEVGAILKRSYWRLWPSERPPPCKYILQSWDTAFTKTDKSNYSAGTTWGVFEHREPGQPKPVDNLILLHAQRDKWEFPELKAEVKRYEDEWTPDEVLIEKKGSGMSLVQELRSTGSSVNDFSPTRAEGDKIVRANAISPTFKAGYVWHPSRRWAEEVIEECASFPRGESDDYVDSVTQAVRRFREGGFIRLPDDDDEDEQPYQQPAGGYY